MGGGPADHPGRSRLRSAARPSGFRRCRSGDVEPDEAASDDRDEQEADAFVRRVDFSDRVGKAVLARWSRTLGMNASMSGGKLKISWSDKFIELLKPMWETERAEETFTMLYQKDMNAPQVFVALGGGAWSGATGKVTGRDIAMDGRLYNQMEFTLSLRLGGNPLNISTSSTGMARFDIIRRTADDNEVPLKVTWDGQAYVKLSSPAGYVKVKAGETIPVEGSLLKPNLNFEQLSLDIYKFVPGSRDGYQSLGGERTTIEIQDNGVFNGSFTLTEPGSYLVSLLSPSYIAASSRGLASTTWAEFVVDVVQ